MTNNTSVEEKIDFIYETLKKQEKRRVWGIVFKWFFRILILAYFYYAFIYVIPGLISDFKESLTPDLSGNIDIEKIKDKIDTDMIKDKILENINF